MNNQIDIEAAEAQAAENAYKEIWDALMVLINMGSRERLINFGFETVMHSLSNFGDYQRFLIEIKAYKEKRVCKFSCVLISTLSLVRVWLLG